MINNFKCIYNIFCIGTTVPENLNQNINNNSQIRITSDGKLQSNYLPDKNTLLIKKNQKKKGKIRFKCLHCEYLTFRKQNLVEHLKKKHEVSK